VVNIKDQTREQPEQSALWGGLRGQSIKGFHP
jgi:hypothetical protein